MKRNGGFTLDAERGLKMYAEILFGLCCFAAGFIAGAGIITAIIVTAVKLLTKRKKPKH